MHESIPDYSQYSFEELCDVVRHIDRDRFPRHYARVMEAVAQHRYEQAIKEAAQQRSHHPVRNKVDFRARFNAYLNTTIPLLSVLEPDETLRNFSTISAWWEDRRNFYNNFVLCIAFSSAMTTLTLMAIEVGQKVPYNFAAIVLWFIACLMLSAFIVLPLLFVFNLIYSFASYLDCLLSPLLCFWGWSATISAFAVVSGLSILSIAAPVVTMLLILWK